MAYLNGNSPNKNQQETEVHQSVELNTEVVQQLESLLNLLADLDLMDLESKSANSSIISKQHSEDNQEQKDSPKSESDAEKSDNLRNQVIKQEPSQNQYDVVEIESISTDYKPEISGEEQLFRPHKLSELELEQPSGHRQEYDADTEALEALQNLLLGSQVARLVRRLNTTLKQKPLNYEQEIEHHNELNNIIGPLFPEVLLNNLGHTDEEIIDKITPVIDRAIQKKFRQDPQAISLTFAPLLPTAIETQIQLEPLVMAEALAPIIDVIIQKKTEQDQQSLSKSLAPLLPAAISEEIQNHPQEIATVLTEAVAPIIDIIIQKKTEQDQQSLSKSLAPLLPAAISEEIQNHPQEIAKALAPEMGAAIREQIRIDRRQISQALAPEMGKAIKEQIVLEQSAIVDALYPVIGSTISKYMTEAIREINDRISDTLSFRGIRRKIQAIFRGVSEAELIISEIMICTVQAVFLIHKTSGLVISEAQKSGRERLESEMVGGMLTAIRSFVNDCIVQSGDISELNQIEYGDSKIILEVAGYCYLAVVIRGEPNKSFLKELRQTLSNIIIDYGKSIKNFDGDTDRIPSSIQLLIKALISIDTQEHNQPQISKPPTALIILSGLIISLILIPWGIFQYYSRVYRSVEARTIEAWNSMPELALYRLNAKVKRGALTLTGQLPNQDLSNQAAEIAFQEASSYNLELNNQIIAVDLPPDLEKVNGEVNRITKALNQMEGVSINSEYLEGKVILKGTVMDMEDTQKIIQKIEQVPGVKSVISTMKLSPLNLKTRIYFDLGSAKLNPAYQQTMEQIQEFLNQYPQKHLRIVGHTDRTGDPYNNQALAIERADTVRNALVQQGADPRRLEVTGQKNSPQDVEYNQPLLLSRCVTFELFEPGAKDN
ncbi:MAG: OmpA family protein [Microcoleaceae cyanobacterium]